MNLSEKIPPRSGQFAGSGMAFLPHKDRHRAFLANLQDHKALEKAAAAQAASARADVERRERGFQGYWQGANGPAAAKSAPRPISDSSPRRAVVSPFVRPNVVAHALAEPRRARRTWELGSPVLLKITDGEGKGEVLHLGLPRDSP